MRSLRLIIMFMLTGLFQTNAQGQELYTAVYIDRFDELLQDTSESRTFLIWAQKNGIRHLSCYDLYTILSKEDLTLKLVAFMQRAKHEYGILSFDAVASSADFLINKVYVFNLQYADKGVAFSGFNLEREWWTDQVTFASHRDNMKQLRTFIRDSTKAGNISLETYIGWFGLGQTHKETEAIALIQYADLISVSAYQKRPHIYYLRSRLEELAKAAEQINKKQDIVILFSMEKEFSGKYSRKHSYDEMYGRIMAEYMQAVHAGHIDPKVATWLNIKGWKVFAQSHARRYSP